MPTKPYNPYNGNNAPEYNYNGDSANGRKGSYSYGSIVNRAGEPQAPKSSNPYGDILSYLLKAQPPSPYQPGTPMPAPGQVPMPGMPGPLPPPPTVPGGVATPMPWPVLTPSPGQGGAGKGGAPPPPMLPNPAFPNPSLPPAPGQGGAGKGGGGSMPEMPAPVPPPQPGMPGPPNPYPPPPSVPAPPPSWGGPNGPLTYPKPPIGAPLPPPTSPNAPPVDPWSTATKDAGAGGAGQGVPSMPPQPGWVGQYQPYPTRPPTQGTPMPAQGGGAGGAGQGIGPPVPPPPPLTWGGPNGPLNYPTPPIGAPLPPTNPNGPLPPVDPWSVNTKNTEYHTPLPENQTPPNTGGGGQTAPPPAPPPGGPGSGGAPLPDPGPGLPAPPPNPNPTGGVPADPGWGDLNKKLDYFRYWIPNLTRQELDTYLQWGQGVGKNTGWTLQQWYDNGRPTNAPPSQQGNPPPGPPGPPAPPAPPTPPVLPPAPPPVEPPATPLPPDRVDPTNWQGATMPNVPDMSGMGEMLRQYYDPQFQQDRQDLTAQSRGLAALTGDTNAGGYGEIEGRNLSRLIGEQSAFIGDKTFQATESAKDRALKQYETDSATGLGRYQIDANKFMQLVEQDTARYGIKTNADMEKYLGDQKTSLAKYGIDTDAVLAIYRADQDLRGTMYSADRQFDAAGLDNAMRKYIADQNYNLGVGQLGLDQYKHDNPSMDALLAYYLGLSPEKLALAGMGQINWPNWIFNQQNQNQNQNP